MSTDEGEKEPEPTCTPPTRTTRAQRNAKSPEKAAPTDAQNASGGKKESFQWSTPADEFADDVGSDIEDMGEEMNKEIDDAVEAAKEVTEVNQETGDIIIRLGSDEANKYSVSSDESKILSNNASPQKKSKKAKSKQQFPCPKCEKVWNWPWELRRHLVMHFKEKERQEASAYKCEECGKGFQWKRDLAQHHRLHTGEKLLICSVCGKKFVTRQALLHHVVVHTGEKPFQCCLCGNRFTQPANLRTHTKKKHGDGPIQGCRCPHCSETYPSIVAIHQHILEDHQNIVAEEREVQNIEKIQKEREKEEREKVKEVARQKREERKKERIDFNDFRAKGLKEWEINYEFHLGEEMKKGVDWDRAPTNGELECEECNQTFGYRYEIMFHRLCHLTDDEGQAKNKICPECDTVFKVPIGLKHHLILHTGELPFLCLHCWRSFSAHIDLKLHIRREHLFHLNVPQPTRPVKRKSMKEEHDTKKKVKKEELGGSDTRAVIVQNGQQEEPQHITVNVGENGQIINAHELGENVQFLQTESGQIIATTGDSNGAQIVNTSGRGEGEQQTIFVGADGQIINPGNQDMIVVIQSEDGSYEHNQGGMIIVDPGQLQQMVGNSSDGSVPQIAIAQGPDGQTMIIQQEGAPQEANAISQAAVATSHTAVTQSSANASGQQMIIADVAGNAANVGGNAPQGAQYISFQVNDDGTAVPASEGSRGEQVVMVNSENGQQVANINGKNYVIVSQQEDTEQTDSSSAATTIVTMAPDDQDGQKMATNAPVSEEQQRQNQEALNAMVQLATSNTASDNDVSATTKEIQLVVQTPPNKENETDIVNETMAPQSDVQNNTESIGVKENLVASENMPTTDEELNEATSGQALKDDKASQNIAVTVVTKEN